MYSPRAATSPEGLITVSVFDVTALPMYRRGDGRMFVPGVPGHAYTMLATNNTHRRIAVVATVDGMNVLCNEPGDPAGEAMVIAPGGSYSFKGWRVNDQDSDKFVFGDLAASVAVQATGSAENAGVLGFAAWREQDFRHDFDYGQPLAVASAGPVSRSATKGMMSADPPVSYGASSIGTGIGERQHDPVGRTTFHRTGHPDILVIGYDTEAELIRRGIYGPPDAEAFPGASTTGYGKFQHIHH